MINCIYKIYSITKPEKIYIGSSVNFVNRKSRHVTSLKNNWHPNKKLQSHYNKYGKLDLVFEVIESGIEIDKLIEREQYYMDLLTPWFNIAKIAGSNLGYVPSEETIKKLKKAGLNRVYSDEELQWKKNFMLGNTWAKNHKHTNEFKKIKKIKMLGNQYAKGFIRSDKFKENLSAMYKGKPFNKEAKAASLLVLSKPVKQFTKDGLFIRDFVSAVEAERTLKIKHVGDCCNKKRKTAGKFKWEWVRTSYREL